MVGRRLNSQLVALGEFRHDLAFTRRVYVHLDADDGPDPSMLDDLAGCAPEASRLRLVAL